MMGGSYRTHRPWQRMRYLDRPYLRSYSNLTNQIHRFMSFSQNRQDTVQGATSPERPAQNEPQLEFARLSPLMPRVHADDQDKKTICLFWSVLLFALLFIVIIAHFAIPDLYERHSRQAYKTSDAQCNFSDTPMISNGSVYCGNYYTSNQPKVGEVIFGWGPMNQFALTYLEVVPVNANTELNFKMDVTMAVWEIAPYYNETLKATHFLAVKKTAEVTIPIDFSSSTAQQLYAEDGTTVHAYHQLLAVITHLSSTPFFIEMTFSQSLNSSQIVGLYSQSKAVNSSFTAYTISLRYSFLATSILALIIYFYRFVKIPRGKLIIQQKFIAVISVLLLMFNDPFYPITILKPNGASAFFSILFVTNLICALFLFWIVTADRILFDDGKIQSDQLTKKKIVYVVILWLEMIIITMIYSVEQINSTPILTNDFNRRFLIARVVIIVTVVIGVLYIGYRYGQICASDQAKLWRSYIFMVFSIVFIVAIFIIVASNTLVPYHYEGSAIFLVYSFVNLYVYYIQYMFTTTREESERMEIIMMEGGVESRHDVLSVGTVDIVDVELEDEEDKYWRKYQTDAPGSVEQNSSMPVRNSEVNVEYEMEYD